MYQPTETELNEAVQSFATNSDINESQRLANFFRTHPVSQIAIQATAKRLIEAMAADQPEQMEQNLVALFATGFVLGQEVLHNASHITLAN